MDNVQPQKRGAAGAFYIVIILILIAAVAVLGYQYYNLKKGVVGTANQQLTEEETNDVIESLGKIMKLPAERPQAAKVLNPDQLKALNPFFNDVQMDDYLLLFPPNKAVIYRPSTNMIVNFDFFVTVDQDQTGTGANTTGTSTR